MQAVDAVWTQLGIKRTSEWAALGGFVGVGEAGKGVEEPLWTDAQLGLGSEGVLVEGKGMAEILDREGGRSVGAVAAAA